MAQMLVGSIDLSKIDKNKIATKDKNGQPFANGAKYLNVVVWLNDEVDQYGNIASIQENVSKEEREQGVKATYIGNLKNIAGQNVNQNPILANAQKSNDVGLDNGNTDDFPF